MAAKPDYFLTLLNIPSPGSGFSRAKSMQINADQCRSGSTTSTGSTSSRRFFQRQVTPAILDFTVQTSHLFVHFIKQEGGGEMGVEQTSSSFNMAYRSSGLMENVGPLILLVQCMGVRLQ